MTVVAEPAVISTGLDAAQSSPTWFPALLPVTL
jgi:hypothetical protein